MVQLTKQGSGRAILKGLMYVTTPVLENHRIAPSPLCSPCGGVSWPLCSWVSDDKPAPRPPSCGVLPVRPSFVNLDRATQFVERPIWFSARFAKPPQDEPRGLLRYANLFGKLQATDPLPRRDKQVHGVHPLVQRYLRFFKNRIRANREIKFASPAAIVSSLPRGAHAKGGYALPRLAVWAKWTIGPEPRLKVHARRFPIGEQRKQLKGADGGPGHLARFLDAIRGKRSRVEHLVARLAVIGVGCSVLLGVEGGRARVAQSHIARELLFCGRHVCCLHVSMVDDYTVQVKTKM